MVGERGFCKGKEYHYLRNSRSPRKCCLFPISLCRHVSRLMSFRQKWRTCVFALFTFKNAVAPIKSYRKRATYGLPLFKNALCRAATTQNLVVKFDGEICGGVLVENASDDFPGKRSSKISFQTSPEVRHQFRRKLRQLHSGNRWCLVMVVNMRFHASMTFPDAML